MSSMDQLIARARSERAAELAGLKSPSRLRPFKRRKHLRYVEMLQGLRSQTDPETDGVECDHSEPRLTVEEWEFVRVVASGGA